MHTDPTRVFLDWGRNEKTQCPHYIESHHKSRRKTGPKEKEEKEKEEEEEEEEEGSVRWR